MHPSYFLLDTPGLFLCGTEGNSFGISLRKVCTWHADSYRYLSNNLQKVSSAAILPDSRGVAALLWNAGFSLISLNHSHQFNLRHTCEQGGECGKFQGQGSGHML